MKTLATRGVLASVTTALALSAQVSCGSGSLPGCEDESNPAVVCPAAVDVVCTGPRTEVDLSAAGSCSGELATDDRPAEGFVVGTTDVVFMAGGESCTSQVNVADETPPTVTCDGEVTVFVTDANEAPVVTSGAQATDDCTDTVDLRVDTLDPPSGSLSVEVIATDLAGNEARCTTTGNVIRALPPLRVAIANAAITESGGTAITLGWESSGPDVTGYRILRADDPEGPFTEVASLPATTLLYEDAAIAGSQASYQVQAIAGELEGGVSEVRTAHAIATTNYDVRDRVVPGINFPTTLYGVVRHPSDLAAGPYPLIVMLHGNHGNCRSSPTDPNDFCELTNDHECANGFTTPNAEGMTYLAETLASLGFIAVTISGNAMNCRQNFIPERAELIGEHLRQWVAWGSAAGDAPFGTTFSNAVDMGSVGLLGHSRGAEAVSLVPSQLAQAPIAGVNVGAIYALAPTDFESPQVVDSPYLLTLPGCDGDVSDLQGIRIYDRSFQANNPGTKAQAFFVGANHNFFNTNWEFDDGRFRCADSARVGNLPQMRMLERSAGDWFRANLQADPFSADQTADAPSAASLEQASGRAVDVRWSYAAPSRILVEDFSDGDASVNELGLQNTASGFVTANLCTGDACGDVYRHNRPGLRLSWSDGTPLLRTNLGGGDFSAQASLAFRVVSVESNLNTGLTDQSFRLRLVDSGGESAELLLLDTQLVPHLYAGANNPHEVLQSVRTPLDDFIAINPDLNLRELEALEIEMTVAGHTSGSLVITDIEFHQ